MYPVPPSTHSPPAFYLPFPNFISGSEFISGIGMSGGCLCICSFVLEGGGLGELGFGYLGLLPKEVKPRPILPLGSLHADPVCRHPGST